MKHNLKKILSSLDGIREVEPRAYLFTRIKVKLEQSREEETSYHKIEKPVVILTTILVIILTIYTLNFNGIDEIKDNYSMEDVYFEEEKNDIINFTSYEE